MKPQSAQEAFWAGNFGDEYTERNRIAPGSRTSFFRQILDLAPGVRSVCEIGANAGHNVAALQTLDPSLRITGIELNSAAFAKLAEITWNHCRPVVDPELSIRATV